MGYTKDFIISFLPAIGFVAFVMGLAFLTGYLAQPDCNITFCNGQTVFVPSENKTGIVQSVDYQNRFVTIQYDVPFTYEQLPGATFTNQTKSFTDVMKIDQ